MLLYYYKQQIIYFYQHKFKLFIKLIIQSLLVINILVKKTFKNI